MIELPEARNLARQISQHLSGKTVLSVTANHSPHKFAWFHEDPWGYNDLLTGKTIAGAISWGGLVEIQAEEIRLVFGDGIGLSLVEPHGKRPLKHQLLVEFNDGTALAASVRMYGGLWCFREGSFDNIYYNIAREKISPLEDKFDLQYFSNLAQGADKLSLKAFLATEQRIPGLGNGVLQDILFNARLHPKRKIGSLSQLEMQLLHHSVVTTLTKMADLGGRDTEKDIFGNPGGYMTILSKNTVQFPCSVCGNTIQKEAYMGGSIYYCPCCQAF